MTQAMAKVIEKAKIVVANQNDNYTIFGDKDGISENWLKNAKIVNQIRLFPDFYGAWIVYENENYLVLVIFSLLKMISANIRTSS